MGRERSRSPSRRKERRRSRSRDRDPEKKLDKFGRDVGSRNERRTDRFSSRLDDSIYERNGSSSSHRGKDEYKKERYDQASSNRYDQPPIPDEFGVGQISSRQDWSSSRYEQQSSQPRYDQKSQLSYQQPPPPPPPPADSYHSNNGQSYSRYDNHYDNQSERDQRKQFKEMFEEKEPQVDEETRRVQQLMGFGNFNTTKNKKQQGNVGGYAKINKPQKYRQYMNRRGGFNRPLDWVG